jgi:[protein-PII] uridylyltransferase
MPTLSDKIAADAGVRLAVTPGHTTAQEVPRLKAFLKVETHRLRLAHRAGDDGGREICQARSAMMDLLLQAMWNLTRGTLSAQAQREFPPLALVALGGYGRGELNPHSDVDLMFLHEGQVVAGGARPLPHLEKMMDGVATPLWDLGLKPGHCVRTIEDCIHVANDPADPRSVETKTSLIEARLIAGDEKLFRRFEKAVLAKCVESHEAAYVKARLTDQATRRAKFGNSATMQEPNVKNGCGGLRDYQNLLWMAWFKYRVRTLKELEERGVLPHAEREQLAAAYDFLLRLRNELHYHTNRATDVLTKALQPAVARQFGFKQSSPRIRIERFMSEVYTHTRAVHLITRTLEQRLALVPSPGKRLPLLSWFTRGKKPAAAPPGETLDGFQFVGGQIVQANNDILGEQPARMMRAFLHAQQRGLGLHPDLASLLRNQLHLVDRQFLHDQHVRETFLAILNHRGNVGAVLRGMSEVGLLARYLPEFGRLSNLVQHEFYHQYTADEHTVQCLEQVDRVWEASAPPYAEYAPLLQSLERPFVLYLALLLHDVGKAGEHADHAVASVVAARKAARRLDLDEPTTETLCRVIEHHILPARTSQLRDLDDPAVIRRFADTVKDLETLRLLTVLTFADSQATSDKLWNGFKDSLLWMLYRRTLPLLTGGPEYERAEEQHRQGLREKLLPVLVPPVDAEQLQAHFDHLPPRYFQIHDAAAIREDLELVAQFMWHQVTAGTDVLKPVIRWRDLPDRACQTVKVCTWDRAGLFGKIAGCLSGAGFNILSAQVFTRTDSIALDTFFVTDGHTGALAEPDKQARFDGLLARVLTGHETDLRGLIARQRTLRPLYQAIEGQRIPTQVTLNNTVSETRTVIELETEDRIGLLFAVSQTLSELGVDISTAKICTERGAALDSFYVSEPDGSKITAPERCRLIERSLRHAIHLLDGAGK